MALIPTVKGLCRLWINPVSETYRLERVLDATLASAPGVMRRHVACLLAGPNGTRLWTAMHDLSGVTLYDCAVPASGWSRPLGYDGRLLWLHAEGQLAWQPGAAPQWMPWPQGWTPRLELGGPTQSRDGRLWQIGHDGQAYSFLELGRAA
ncbi:hypothetical protein LP420_27680 [Massilia sp. B-10]|nr:hypothetical protein LP420_27680 [Massilia sp. B-10]